jgi:hypothetical protein
VCRSVGDRTAHRRSDLREEHDAFDHRQDVPDFGRCSPGLGRPDEDTRGGFTHGGWGPQYNDEVMGRELVKGMAEPGDMLFGRLTWQDFTTAWGNATDDSPFTTHMNAATKYVASRLGRMEEACGAHEVIAVGGRLRAKAP